MVHNIFYLSCLLLRLYLTKFPSRITNENPTERTSNELQLCDVENVRPKRIRNNGRPLWNNSRKQLNRACHGGKYTDRQAAQQFPGAKIGKTQVSRDVHQLHWKDTARTCRKQRNFSTLFHCFDPRKQRWPLLWQITLDIISQRSVIVRDGWKLGEGLTYQEGEESNHE